MDNHGITRSPKFDPCSFSGLTDENFSGGPSPYNLSGCVALSVTCLATDASLTADPGVPSLIPARSHTFVEIDH